MLAESYLRSGKVRDLYSINDSRLVLVASDRISAFDVVLPSTIPDKGRVLTGLSRFWFTETASIVRNHLLGTDPAAVGDMLRVGVRAAGGEPPERGPLAGIRGRIMICRPAAAIPVEAVVRGYLAGSGWKEYREHGTVCGIRLPGGLRESDRLPEPIFTPATKADPGEHDENISFDRMIGHLAARWPDPGFAGPLAESMREHALALYRYGAALATRRGILIADTKFEFGLVDDGVILIDEVMTPDSSRFWDAATYEPGQPQASFDKQFVRDWLETRPWDKTAPGPELPPEVIEGTRARYVEAYERITGASFARYLAEDVIAP
jgi:phosphoribosylaminoimidazole-succinocarboxamide synthase